MKLGIDVGGSFIKLATLGENGEVLSQSMERSVDIQDTVLTLAGRAAQLCAQAPSGGIFVTGVGAGAVANVILGVPVVRVPEFRAIAVGGLDGAALDEAVIVSMGTGSALVYAGRAQARHLGGSGVGGGTIEGLARSLLGTDDFHEIDRLSQGGSLPAVDLLIRDVAAQEIPGLPVHATAANLHKLKASSAACDAAAGLLNMVYQTVGTLAVFACRALGINDVVLTGSVAGFSRARELVDGLTGLYGTRFTIPPNPAYRTAIGAALGTLGASRAD